MASQSALKSSRPPAKDVLKESLSAMFRRRSVDPASSLRDRSQSAPNTTVPTPSLDDIASEPSPPRERRESEPTLAHLATFDRGLELGRRRSAGEQGRSSPLTPGRRELAPHHVQPPSSSIGTPRGGSQLELHPISEAQSPERVDTPTPRLIKPKGGTTACLSPQGKVVDLPNAVFSAGGHNRTDSVATLRAATSSAHQQLTTIPPSLQIDIEAESNAKAAAEKAMDKMKRVAEGIKFLKQGAGVAATVGAFAGGTLLMSCMSIVSDIWDNVQLVQTNKLSTFRLIERCANIISALVNQILHNHAAYGDDLGAGTTDGERTAGFKDDETLLLVQNLEGLKNKLSEVEAFVQRQREKTFLKLYLHAQEDASTVQELSQDISDTVVIFQLQNQIDSIFWERQFQKDLKADAETLMLNIARMSRESEQTILEQMQINHAEMADVIKTLLRVLRKFETDGEDEIRPEEVAFVKAGLTACVKRSNNNDVDLVEDWAITELELEILSDVRSASGYYAIVKKARWRSTQVVAVKILAERLSNRDTFLNEVNIWRRLRFQHILPFLGASSTTSNTDWFFVSPFQVNGNVLEFLRAHPHESRLRIIHEIALGMSYLHSRDVIHGDLKSSNVLISDNGQALICDFGLSRIKRDIEILSAATKDPPPGTIRWMSPERLIKGVLSKETDVYAYAITAFEVIEPLAPFGFKSEAEIRITVMEEDGRPEFTTATSLALRMLIAKAWDRNPDIRTTMDTLARQAGTLRAGRLNAPLPPIPSRPTLLPSIKSFASVTSTTSKFTAQSSSPVDVETAIAQNSKVERAYHRNLDHPFDDRLSLPLWCPAPIAVGTVGFMTPGGQFHTLFEIGNPPNVGSDHIDRFPIAKTDLAFTEHGSTSIGSRLGTDVNYSTPPSARFVHRADTPGPVLPTCPGLSRKVDFGLRHGITRAGLVANSGETVFLRELNPYRKWFEINFHKIAAWLDSLAVFRIKPEALVLVVGVFRASQWALLCSQGPTGTVSFEVPRERNDGETWGTWRVDLRKANGSGPSSRAVSLNPEDASSTSDSLKSSPTRSLDGMSDGRIHCKVSSAPSHDLKRDLDTLIVARLRMNEDGKATLQ